MWHSYLHTFFTEYAYPDQGAESLLKALDQVLNDPQLSAVLLAAVKEYENGSVRSEKDIQALLLRVREAAAQSPVRTEEAELLFFLLCTKHLKGLYEKAGLPMAYYAGVASDLRSKLNECHAVRGIWGSFVAHWFARFFAVDRFVIGRLQYELISMPACISPDGKHCFRGEKAVNVHIPSGRPLLLEEVRASMQEAAAFFAPHFPEGKVLFICHSWLLFPGHYEMLPETSKIRQFMEEFTIIHTDIHPKGNDLWRIFDTDDTADLASLPQETSLQRAYLRWLQAGKPVGAGLGIRYMDI